VFGSNCNCGFLVGGEVAHLAALEQLRSALNPGPGRFAAHVAFYPAGNFGAMAERGAYTGSPVLMLLGEKDDNLPVAKIESYLAYTWAAGNPAPIEAVTYPGAYHAWTVPSLVGMRFDPEYVSTKKCPLESGQCYSSTVKKSRWTQAPSVRAWLKLPDTQWHMMRRFGDNRSLMQCAFLSEISNISARPAVPFPPAFDIGRCAVFGRNGPQADSCADLTTAAASHHCSGRCASP
jgi:hypothetical protein